MVGHDDCHPDQYLVFPFVVLDDVSWLGIFVQVYFKVITALLAFPSSDAALIVALCSAALYMVT